MVTSTSSGSSLLTVAGSRESGTRETRIRDWTWSAELPSERGWYWCRWVDKESGRRRSCVLEVRMRAGNAHVNWPYTEPSGFGEGEAEWAGPIKRPSG